MTKTQRRAIRRAIGADHVGMARLIEGTAVGIHDHRTAFAAAHSEREKAELEVIQRTLVKCANRLRVMGNHMENTGHDT
jgi:hypothetical protein